VTPSQKLIENGLYLATAESLTAGLVSAELANTPGASMFLLGGTVCYQDEIKIHQLGVDPELISQHGPVDPNVAIQMATGARVNFARDCSKASNLVIGISTTGVAGPDPVGDKPVGLVFIGISSQLGERAIQLHLSGSRAEIRAATVSAALSTLEDEIQLLLG
jgi:PncC family amidohydrolase